MGASVPEPRPDRSDAPALRLTRDDAARLGALETDGAHDPTDPDRLAATVAAAGRGDADAWRRLVGAYTPRVFAMVRSRVRDPELAEEVTQSVFATVAGRLGGGGGYDERGRFESWLFRVAMNRVRDEARRRRRRSTLQERIAVEPKFSGVDPAGIEPADGRRTDLGPLRTALAGLNDKDREIVELRHHAQMSFKQIAAMLEEPVGTLLARHHRALRKLRDLIEDASSPEGGPGGLERAT